MIRRIISILLLSCAVTSIKAAPITVVTEDLWPFNYLEQGNIKGPHTRVVKALLTTADVDYEMMVLPWARSYQLALTKPDVLIYTINHTKERSNKFHWIGRFPSKVNINYYALKKSAHQNKSLKQLQALKIGTQIGSTNDTYITNNGFKHISRVNHIRQTLGMLKRGRIDIMIASPEQLARAAKDIDVNINELIVLQHAFSAKPSIAMSLQTSPQRVQQMRAAYNTLTHNINVCELMQYTKTQCLN